MRICTYADICVYQGVEFEDILTSKSSLWDSKDLFNTNPFKFNDLAGNKKQRTNSG